MGKDATVAAAATINNAVNVNLAHASEVVELKGNRVVLIGDNVRVRVADNLIPEWEENQLTGAVSLVKTNSTNVSVNRILAVLNSKYNGFTEWWANKKQESILNRVIAISGNKDARTVKDTLVLGLAMETASVDAKRELISRLVVDIKFIPLNADEKYDAADGYCFDFHRKIIATELDVRVHPELKAAFDTFAVPADDNTVEFV